MKYGSARAIAGALLAALAGAGPARADQATPPDPVALEQLLKLPDSHSVDVHRRGGATRGEWRARFLAAREDLETARAALDGALSELAELAGETESWQVSAPGVDTGSVADSPLDYRLRQEIRRQRDEVERLERRLDELRVEANLAGVPPEWYESAGLSETSSEGSRRSPPTPVPGPGVESRAEPSEPAP